MSAARGEPGAPFGRVLTAMITPMRPDGSVDPDGAARLAQHLVASGSDGLVVNGTTGESATTSDAEKLEVLAAVLAAVGSRAQVLAGVGSADTAHTCRLAAAAATAGAHGLLVVTPYYSRPTQAGIIAHVERVAGTTDLPIMLYDIPSRTATALTTETLIALGEHPNVLAVKDAKGDLVASSWLLARSPIALYSGDDAATLPLLAIGGCGVVSVVTHVLGPQVAAMVSAAVAGDFASARAAHRALLPAFTGFFRLPNPILTKAACGLAGLPAGPPRLPLLPAGEPELAVLAGDLRAAGAVLPGAA